MTPASRRVGMEESSWLSALFRNKRRKNGARWQYFLAGSIDWQTIHTNLQRKSPEIFNQSLRIASAHAKRRQRTADSY
jgi:hypothetical protein